MSVLLDRIMEGSMVLLIIGIFLAFARAVRGPRFTDRIVAINMIGTMTTAIICILSAYLKESMLVDVALVYTLLSFLSLLGIYRLKYVMNRMHAAAMGDTMGLGLVVIGLIILGHDVFHIAKYILVILFFWMSSPIASHMIGKVEMLTNKDYDERVHGK